MSISDELTKLAKLKEDGVLSDEEFEQAKKKILSGSGSQHQSRGSSTNRSYQFEDRGDDSVGKAANRYVSFQIVMAVIGIIIFLLFFAPVMCSSGSPGFSPTIPR